MASKSIYMPELATIEKIETLSAMEKFLTIRLDSGKELGQKPGQFVEVSIFGIGEAPISISSSPTQKGIFELGVRRVGNVTSAMHNLKVGSKLGIRGPFGSSFPYDETKGKDLLFVVGGIGLFPGRSFINYALHNRKDYGRIIILFGSKDPSNRILVNELKEWGERSDVEFLETVDRSDTNWKGNTGVITTLFPKINIDAEKTVCVIIGPPIMYRFVIIEAKKKGLTQDNIYMSLERRMKCGVGKCGHCQINQYYCCQDGPVFSYAQIKPLPEAL